MGVGKELFPELVGEPEIRMMVKDHHGGEDDIFQSGTTTVGATVKSDEWEGFALLAERAKRGIKRKERSVKVASVVCEDFEGGGRKGSREAPRRGVRRLYGKAKKEDYRLRRLR